MPTKPGKLKTNAAHLEKLDRLNIRPYKAEGEKIRNAAKDAEQSVTAYVLQAVRERMERDAVGTDPGELNGTRVVSLPVETVEAVQTAAETAGLSVNQWIIEAIRDKL